MGGIWGLRISGTGTKLKSMKTLYRIDFTYTYDLGCKTCQKIMLMPNRKNEMRTLVLKKTCEYVLSLSWDVKKNPKGGRNMKDMTLLSSLIALVQFVTRRWMNKTLRDTK